MKILKGYKQKETKTFTQPDGEEALRIKKPVYVSQSVFSESMQIQLRTLHLVCCLFGIYSAIMKIHVKEGPKKWL